MAVEKIATNYGIMYAGLVIVMLPTLILYIALQKKLTQGMSLGGLKDYRLDEKIRRSILLWQRLEEE